MGLKHIMICEPLELEYAAAGLHDHQVQILDLILERGLERRLRQFQPDLVGTSCYINGVNEVKKICRTVKRWNPACRTVVGGVHASRAPEDFADPSVDCVALGDGTTTLPRIVDAVARKAPLESTPGLAIPCGENAVAFTKPDAYMPDPDSLPLPRRELTAHLRSRYYYLFHQPVTIIKTTWGCWYKCNFCFNWRVTDGLPFSRSPESIVDELAQIETEHVYIVDDIFLINRTRLNHLSRLLSERGIHKKYLVYGRADFVAENEDIIEEWAHLGLSAVIVGLEATTDPELASMNKETTVDSNRRAIAVLRRHGVDTYASLIPQPDYMPEDWARLQRFIEDNGLFYLNISPLTPMPGTTIWDQYKDQITVSRSAHGLWDLSHPVLPTQMPLKAYYRSLLGVYTRSVMDVRRANRLMLGARPPMWSPKFLRLWLGALKVLFQLRSAHHHHSPRQLARAMDTGPEVPGLSWPAPPADVSLPAAQVDHLSADGIGLHA